jgi:hypothetical protein
MPLGVGVSDSVTFGCAFVIVDYHSKEAYAELIYDKYNDERYNH